MNIHQSAPAADPATSAPSIRKVSRPAHPGWWGLLAGAALTAAGVLVWAAWQSANHQQTAAERQIAQEADAFTREAARELARFAAERQEAIERAGDQARLEAGEAVEILRNRVAAIFDRPPTPPAPPPLPPALRFLGELALALHAERSEKADDPAAKRLRDELRVDPPAGCVFAIHEDYTRPLLAYGGDGGDAPENAWATAFRDYAFFDGQRHRFWQLQARVAIPDPPEPLTAREAADALDRRFAGSDVLSSSLGWRGLLYDAEDGSVLACFPPLTEKSRQPLLAAAADWQAVGSTDGSNRGLYARVWRAAPSPPAPWLLGIETRVERPAPAVALLNEIRSDNRWSVALGATLLTGLAGGVMAFRAWRRRRRLRPVAAVAAPLIERIDGSAASGLRDEVFAAGGEEIDPQRWQREYPVAGSSLRRLQALHRGGDDRLGSRVLDHSTSPLLRELAKRSRARGSKGTPMPRATVAASTATATVARGKNTATLTAATPRTAVATEPPPPPVASMSSEAIVGELMRRTPTGKR